MHFPCWFAKLSISFVVPKAFSHQKEEADCFLDVLSMGNGYTFCYNFFKYGVTLADIIQTSPLSNQIRTLIKRSHGSNHYRNLFWIWKILAFWIRPGKDQYFGKHTISTNNIFGTNCVATPVGRTHIKSLGLFFCKKLSITLIFD